MDLTDGFRNTDLGVFPNDWTVDQLGSLNPFVTSGSRGWARYYADRGALFVRITNLSRASINLDLADLKLVNLPSEDREGLRTQLQPGDLLVSITADIGIIGYVDSRVPQPAYINQHIALVRCDASAADTRFLAYFLASERPQRAFRAATDQGAKAGMNLAGVLRIQSAFPPIAEQRAIAAALRDVDALLGGLNQLIAKKRDLKQAAMQQLLTGQTRLPGFHGKWEFGNLASVIGALDAGVSVNSVEDDGGDGFDGMFILKTSAVAGGRFVPRECKRIAPKDLSRACLNPLKGMVIISRMNTPELVGECGYVDRDYPNLFVPDRLWMTRFKPDLHLSGLWLSYLLSTAALKGQIGAAATGTSGSMKNLSKQTFLQIPIALPSGREQSAIAAVLSDMDAELSALESRRDKTRALKQGMMQELLTGKTRLVAAGGACA